MEASGSLSRSELRHPKERTAFTIACLAGAVPLALVLVALIASVPEALIGIAVAIAVFVPVGMFARWCGARLLRGHLMNQGVRVGPNHFPEIHQAAQEAATALGWRERVEVFVLEGSVVNALLSAVFRTRYIILFSELIDGMLDSPAQLRTIIGHELGHLAAGHLKWRWLVLLGAWVPFLYLWWSRLCEYTCDRHGFRAANDPEEAQRALSVLCVGWRLAQRVDPERVVGQANEAETGLAARIMEMLSTHPPTTKRIRELRQLALGPAAVRVPAAGGVTFASILLAGPSALVSMASSGGVLVPVAVIGVLAAMLFPVFARAREQAQFTECLTNIKNVSVAAIMYEMDYGRLPELYDWEEELEEYLLNPNVFHCPGDEGFGVSYALNPEVAGRSLAEFGELSEVIMFYEVRQGEEAYPHLGRASVAYLDGQVRSVTRSDLWESMTQTGGYGGASVRGARLRGRGGGGRGPGSGRRRGGSG